MPTREEQREQSQHRIIEAGLRLFSENGYGSTSIRQIARGAGISLGLLYNYYESKEDLLKSVIHECRRDVVTSFEETLDQNITDLSEFLPTVFAMVKARPTFWRLVYMLRFQQGILGAASEEIDDLLSLIYTRLESYFTAAGHPNPKANARLLFAAIVGISSQMLTEPDYPDAMVIQQLIHTFKGQ
jgi:AcrR family transcriptional regulator